MGLRLKVEERDLGGRWVEAYYSELPTFRGMAIQAGIPPVRARLYELAAHGLACVPQSTQRLLAREYTPGRGDFVFFVPRSSAEASPLLVRAVGEVLREMEPGWISAVQEVRGSTDGPDDIAFWSKVPIEAVLAVAGDRHDRL